MEKEISYNEIEKAMNEIIECANIAKSECKKEKPDLVILCDNAFENIEKLLERVERCILSLD